MTLLRLIVGLMLLAGAALAQVPGQPVVRTSLNPKDGIIIGQPVQLYVDVLFPGEMPRPPLVTIGEAPGAQILRFETQATTMRDRIGDQDYVGQRFEFTIFPRRGGMIDVPAAEVTLRNRASETVGVLKTDPSRFAVTVPPGIDASGPVLAAASVKVSQSWSRDPGTTAFKAGDAVTRSIRRQATDVPALGMAAFRFTAPDGVAVYPDAPVIDDRVNRGSVEGMRTDTVTYVFEKPGSYNLPELSQPWWDTDDRQVKSEILAGASFNVAAAAPAETGRRSSARRGLRSLVLILCGTLLLLGLVSLRPRLRAIWQAHRQGYLGSEAHARKALRDAAHTGDPVLMYRTLVVWRDRLPADVRCEVEMDHRLQPLVADLEHCLFGANGSWSRQQGADLAERVEMFRVAKKARRVSSSLALPLLNPRPR